MSKPFVTGQMRRDGFFRGAAFSVVVSLAAFAIASVGAVRIADVEAASAPPEIPDSALQFGYPGAGPNIAGAVANDLFTDDRQAPPRRYLMPGEADAGARQPPALPVVLGTVMASDGANFAICQIGAGQSTIVRAGGKIGEFTVISIERGRVHFRAPDGERISIDASNPVP